MRRSLSLACHDLTVAFGPDREQGASTGENS
jgi:hypothetical protein